MAQPIIGTIRPFQRDPGLNSPVYSAPSTQENDEIIEGNFANDLKFSKSTNTIVMSPFAGKIGGMEIVQTVDTNFVVDDAVIDRDIYVVLRIDNTVTGTTPANLSEFDLVEVAAGETPVFADDYNTVRETPIAKIENVTLGTVDLTINTVVRLVLPGGREGAEKGFSINNLYNNTDFSTATTFAQVIAKVRSELLAGNYPSVISGVFGTVTLPTVHDLVKDVISSFFDINITTQVVSFRMEEQSLGLNGGSLIRLSVNNGATFYLVYDNYGGNYLTSNADAFRRPDEYKGSTTLDDVTFSGNETQLLKGKNGITSVGQTITLARLLYNTGNLFMTFGRNGSTTTTNRYAFLRFHDTAGDVQQGYQFYATTENGFAHLVGDGTRRKLAYETSLLMSEIETTETMISMQTQIDTLSGVTQKSGSKAVQKLRAKLEAQKLALEEEEYKSRYLAIQMNIDLSREEMALLQKTKVKALLNKPRLIELQNQINEDEEAIKELNKEYGRE